MITQNKVKQLKIGSGRYLRPLAWERTRPKPKEEEACISKKKRK